MSHPIRHIALIAAVVLTPIGCGSDDATDDAANDTAGDSNTGDSGSVTDDADSSSGSAMGDIAAGSDVFIASCGLAGCHGANGNSGPGPNLTSAVPSRDDEGLVSTIQFGVSGVGMSPGMPGQNLSEQDLQDVMAYLRETFP